MNKRDEIHFIYDSQLLSETAIVKMNAFCRQHSITPVDVRTDIIPASETPEENQLIALYEDEVSHLSQGGNLAVASDLIRWLKPVYQLGTYSDFDTNIDTRKLPKTIPVEAPILMNIGSTVVQSEATFPTYAVPLLNNDIISVVDPIASQEYIRKIQRAIHQACTSVGTFSDCIDKITHGYRRIYGHYTDAVLQISPATTSTISILTILDAISRMPFLSRKLREEIIRATDNNQIYCETVCEGLAIGKIAAQLRSGMSSQLSQLETMEETSHTKVLSEKQRNKMLTLLKGDDEQVVTDSREKLQHELIKNSVVYTTGPARIQLTLFSEALYKASDPFDRDVSLLSYGQYEGLSSAFSSGNSVPLHSTSANITHLMQLEAGESNDISWLKIGHDALKRREERMEKAASRIQHAYRQHKQQGRKAALGEAVSQAVASAMVASAVVASIEEGPEEPTPSVCSRNSSP